MKRFLSFLLVLTVFTAIGLAGCKSSTGTSDESSTSADTQSETQDNIKLRISWWGSQVRNDGTLRVLDMYSGLNPHITFQPEYTSWADYWDKMASEAAANNLPDVIQHDYAYIAQYVNKNLLLPLDDHVASGLLNMSDVEDSIKNIGMIDGKLYGITLAVNSRALVYDPALFEKAGVPMPDEDWTWEDFSNACLTIKEKLGIYGAGSIAGELYEGFTHYLRQNGVTIYSKDGKKLGYDDDKYFIDFFKMELDLVKAGALPLPSERLEVKGVEDDFIVSGKAAMGGYVKHSNNISEITKFAGRPLDLAIYPNGKNQVQYGLYIKPSMFFTAFKSTKYPEEAVKFISYFINDIEANKVLAAERGVPVSSAVREALLPLMSDANKIQFRYMEMATSHSSPIDPPEPLGHAEVVSILKNLQQEILYERISLEDAARTFRTEAEKVLAKN